MTKIYTPHELNGMSDEGRKAALEGGTGQRFGKMANEHVTWIRWTKETSTPADILDHGTPLIHDHVNRRLKVPY